jgi:glycosyltransferase involved in cell wall biosynthesis
MVKRERSSAVVLYTAVLPAYRRFCLELVEERLGDAWTAFAGAEYLDPTLRTDMPPHLYTPVSNRRWCGGRLLFQWGHWRDALAASTAVFDLNPRSLSAWCLLLARKVSRRRTLLWGHLDPRNGSSAPTARLRAAMRGLADGCIVYSYENARRLRATAPAANVWVAPNALYPTRFLKVTEGGDRRLILYVGRLEPAKKPRLLLDAFALVAAARPEWDLVMVGEGCLRPELSAAADALGLGERVRFPGAIQDVSALAALYARAHCSVSPGYVGLALTQSLGFGVPMVVADCEPHAPEIEMADMGAVVFFRRGSAADLAAALQSPTLLLDASQRRALVEQVRKRYSADAMARGLVEAIMGRPSEIAADRVPS